MFEGHGHSPYIFLKENQNCDHKNDYQKCIHLILSVFLLVILYNCISCDYNNIFKFFLALSHHRLVEFYFINIHVLTKPSTEGWRYSYCALPVSVCFFYVIVSTLIWFLFFFNFLLVPNLTYVWNKTILHSRDLLVVCRSYLVFFHYIFVLLVISV